MLATHIVCSAPATAAPVIVGIDILLDKRIDLIAGKRVGLVTNPSAVDGKLVSTMDRLRRDPRVQLTQLFAPEHGIAGALANGSSGKNGVDKQIGLPVEGLFGRHHGPTAKALGRIDVLVFDIQDIGSRTYTYISTLGKMMQAATKAKVPMIVLDRPNPQGGLLFEGPIRAQKYKSLIGWAPLPVTHGMTVGELARFYNGELNLGTQLTVVPMEGWRRAMHWEDTGLEWIPTSPGIPHALNAHLYVATGMVGGSGANMNEGAGNSMPFEIIGSTFIHAADFVELMQKEGLEGLVFRALTYKPKRGQFAGKVVQGVQLLLRDRQIFRPLRTALVALIVLHKAYPKQLKVTNIRKFGRVWGNDAVLKQIMAGKGWREIEASWAPELQEFAQKRQKYLIYQ